MTAERWARIKTLFQEASELGPAERAPYLDSACEGDAALRQEIERLLAVSTETLESPVKGVLARAALPDLERGSMLGHYRVETKVGQGGMGAVYRAHDTRLDRRIALKILAAPTPEADSNERVLREARAASALAHPNIVTVHDVGRHQSLDFIAMEYVDGRSLEDLIPAAGLPLRQALPFATQIAEALASAHAAGVVHRDLKPANIMVTAEGTVKLLDFGLARRTPRGEAAHADARLAGTPCYMSPEQVRGEPLDARSDLFSFGLVLYRMLTGADAFDRGSALATMDAIASDEPAPLPPLSPALVRLLAHCLEKRPDARFQSARDIAYALELATLAPEPAPPERLSPTRRFAWGAGLAALSLLAGALATRAWLAANKETLSLDGRVFAQLTDENGAQLFPSLSPDGTQLAYASKAGGNWDLYLRPLGGAPPVNLTTNCADDDTQPAFSPNGGQLAFRSSCHGAGLFVINTDGTGLRRVSPDGFNPAWSPDGRSLVFSEEGVTRPEDRTARLSRLWKVDLASGQRQMLTHDDGVQPAWSPDGRSIAYWGIDLDGARDLRVINTNGGEPIRLTRDHFVDWNPVWSPTGDALYFCSNRLGSMGLFRLPMKESGLEARSAPEPVHLPWPYPAHLAFAAHAGRLAFVSQLTTGRLQSVRLQPETATVLSEPHEILASPAGLARPALSPDGRFVAYNSTEQEERLYIVATDGSGLRQLTSGPGRHRGPRWSPDGRRLACFSDRGGEWEIWSFDLGTGNATQLTALAGQNVAWPVWSHDGRSLAYSLFGVATFLLDSAVPFSAQKPRKLPPYPTQGRVFSGWNWSPDGSLLAGFLNNNDGVALYDLATGSYKELTHQGSDPVWMSDNRRLLFHDRGRLQIVDRVTGIVREVLSIAPEEIARRGFALSPDNTQIYFSVNTMESNIWLMELER